MHSQHAAHTTSSVLLSLVLLLVFIVLTDRSSSSSRSIPTQLLIPSQYRELTACNSTRWRREIRDMTKTELEKFKQAMGELIFKRGITFDYFPPPSFWDSLVAAHIAHMDEAHDGAYFLPWHRLFLLTIENEVRRTIDQNFTMPYWDWTIDAANPSQSIVFSNDYVGSSQPLKPVLDGPFHELNAIYPRPRSVTRGFDSSIPNDILDRNKVRFSTRLNISHFLAESDWAVFAESLEEAHDIVHVGLGGTLGSFDYSPNDPLFYLIHSFVDKVWVDRQQKSTNRYEFSGTHRLGGEFVEAKRAHLLGLFGRTVNYSLGVDCVRYVPYRECEDE